MRPVHATPVLSGLDGGEVTHRPGPSGDLTPRHRTRTSATSRVTTYHQTPARRQSLRADLLASGDVVQRDIERAIGAFPAGALGGHRALKVGRPSAADLTVDELTEDVGMTGVPGCLLEQVRDDPAS